MDATVISDARTSRLDAGFAEDVAFTDAAEAVDAGSGVADLGFADVGVADAGLVDAGTDAGLPVDSGITCNFGAAGDTERPRTVLVSHPYDANAGRGHEVRSLTLQQNGTLVDNGMRLDTGARVKALAFVPSGELALALGEDGELVSLAVLGTTLSVLDMIQLPSADYGEIHISPDGQTAWIIGLNVAETSGISVVRIDCSGLLLEEPNLFLNIRLAESLAFLPGGQRAVLLGGQAVFDPMDPKDLRVLELNALGGFSEIDNADIFHDIVSTGRIAVSPNGRTLMVPNNSIASNETSLVLVADINGTVLSEASRIMNLDGPEEALFSPDGVAVLVTRPEANRVTVLRDSGSGWAVAFEIGGLGLVDQMAMVPRGSLLGLVLLPSIDTNGTSNVAMLKIDPNGVVRDLGQLDFGDGFEEIPEAIAVMQ